MTDSFEIGDEYVYQNEIPRLARVAPELLRGGQPSRAGLETLKHLGVRTIINLREEETAIELERQMVDSLSMTFLSIPLRPFDVPSSESIETFLARTTDGGSHPVFVHCLHGMDRTGLMVALYRMKVMDWSFEPAYDEMLKFGFHEAFHNLRSVAIESAIAWNKLPAGFPVESDGQ